MESPDGIRLAPSTARTVPLRQENDRDMKKLALLLSVVLAAGVASAAQATKSHAAKHVAKASAGKTHDVTAEVVAVDAEKKTITVFNKICKKFLHYL